LAASEMQRIHERWIVDRQSVEDDPHGKEQVEEGRENNPPPIKDAGWLSLDQIRNLNSSLQPLSPSTESRIPGPGHLTPCRAAKVACIPFVGRLHFALMADEFEVNNPMKNDISDSGPRLQAVAVDRRRFLQSTVGASLALAGTGRAETRRPIAPNASG
jgi:hypothetical protein